MQENNHALTSITFSENGRERRIDIQHVIWAFEWEGALYLVDKNKKCTPSSWSPRIRNSCSKR